MNRKIKFRAYQKTPSLNHKPGLYEVTGLDFYEGDYGGGEVCLRNKKGQQWTEYIKDVVLEQYTGLKDKNGKEIYEGDIAKARWYRAKHARLDTKGEIRFNDGWFYIHDDPDGQDRLGVPVHNCYSIEVIGNIHENPELLGGEE